MIYSNNMFQCSVNDKEDKFMTVGAKKGEEEKL